jgi:hypothetical protein
MNGLPPPATPVAKISASQDNDLGVASVFVKMPPSYDDQSSFVDIGSGSKRSFLTLCLALQYRSTAPIDPYKVGGM